MKKAVFLLSMLMLVTVYAKSDGTIIIPNEAIRIRVIANSDSIEDQNIKNEVKEDLQEELTILLKDATSVDEVRSLLEKSLEDFHISVEKTLKRNNVSQTFHINYGLNYFPPKEFKGVTYDEGYYESIVVTLGKGEGDNWWCVLFPPLCLLEVEENQMQDVEYKSFVKETIDKYFLKS